MQYVIKYINEWQGAKGNGTSHDRGRKTCKICSQTMLRDGQGTKRLPCCLPNPAERNTLWLQGKVLRSFRMSKSKKGGQKDMRSRAACPQKRNERLGAEGDSESKLH